MKKEFLTIALCLISDLAFSQVRPEFESGSNGLLLSFAGLNNLNANSFNGGKYYLSSTTTVRASLRFITANPNIPANPPSGFAGQDGEISASTFGVSGALKFHRGFGRVSPFLRLGLSTTSTEDREMNIGPPSAQRVIKNDPQGENMNGVHFQAGTQFDLFACWVWNFLSLMS